MAQPTSMFDVYRGEIGKALADGTTAETLRKDDKVNAFKAAAALPVAIPIALVDGTLQTGESLKNFVVADKLGFKQMHSDRFDDNSAGNLINKVGMSGFADLYQRNRGGYQAAGDIATIFTGAGAVRSGVRAGTKETLQQTAKTGVKVKGESLAGTAMNLMTLPTRATMVPYNAAVKQFTQTKTGKFIFGDYSVIQRQVDAMDDIAMSSVKRNKQLSDLRADPDYMDAVSKVQKSQFKQSAREALATEALLFASLGGNNSEFIFPEGMTAMDHAFWTTVGVVVPTGIDQLVLNAGIRKTAARSGKVVAEERSAAGYFATADLSTNFFMNAGVAQKADSATGGLQGVARDNNDAMLTQAQTALRRGTERLGAATPIETFVEFKPSKQQELLMAAEATKNPHQFRGITSLNDLPTGTQETLGLPKTQEVLQEELGMLSGRDDLTRDELLRMDNIDRQLDEIDRTTSHGIDVDGTAFTVGERSDTVFDDFINVKKTANGYANVVGLSRRDSLTPAGKLSRKVKSPHMANLKDVTNSYALMPAAKGEFIEELRKAAVGKKVAAVDGMLDEFATNLGNGEKLSYIETDYALEVLTTMRDEPTLMNASQLLAGKFATGSVDDLITALETAGLQKKFKDMQQFVAARNKKGGTITPMDMSRRYNMKLHHGDAMTPTPVYEVLMQRVVSGKQFGSYGEFKAQVDLLAASRVGAGNADDIDVAIKGNNTEIDLGVAPMVYTVNDTTRSLQETMSITAAGEVLHLEKIDRTLDAVKYYDGMEDGIFVNVAARVEESGLREEIRNLVPTIVAGQEGQAAVRQGKGVVPAAVNSVVPQDRQFRNRNVEGFAVIDALMDGIYKAAQKKTTEMFEPYKETYRKFHSTRQGKQDQLSMNLYLNSRGAGFDIDIAASTKFGDTKLQPTTKNIDLLSKYIGKDKAAKMFADGDVLLPDMTKLREGVFQPVFVSAGAEEIMAVTNRIYSQVQDNRNVLRIGGGEEVVKVDGLMLPPAFTKNKEVAVIMKRGSNEIDEIVFGNSQQLALDKANKLANKDTQHVASRREVEEILPHRLNNAFAEKSYNSAGSANTDGALALEGMNRWMIDSMNNVAKSSVNRVFEPEMNYLSQQQALHGKIAGEAITDRKQVSVYETMRNVFLNNKDEATGNAVIKLQSRIDELLDAGVGFAAENLSKASGVLRNNGNNVSGKLLDEFAEKASYRPSVRAFEQAGLALPNTSVALARKMNGMAGFFLLRLGEISQSILNVASVPTVVPALHSQLGARAGETYEQFQKRVGGFADLVGKGNLTAAPSPAKGMINAMHLYSNQEGRDIMRAAEKLGNMYAPAVELQEHVFTRGKVLDNKYFDKFVEIITKPTDWTEKLSRQLSYLNGFDMLRRMSPDMTEMELHTAANAFANRSVGDYRTVNKPQQFQGGIGSSMGLFQTFFINYWQRMGDMVEAGNKRGLVTLYGTQASMFGLESLPGYDVYNQMWSNYDGSVAPTDLFAESFGVETAELMLTGGLSNIPKLFGQDGIALYSRGDTNVRQIPNVTNALQVPALNMMNKMGKGVVEYAKTTRALGELPSGSRTLEIAAGSVPSRPAAGIIELINGHAVNRGGDLTVKDTRDSAVRIVSRVIGAKTVEEERTASTMWRQKKQQRIVQQHVSAIKRDFASQIRGNDDVLTVDMLDKFHAKHYEKLQNPETFKTWIGTLYKKSVDEKASRDMLMLYKRIAKGEDGPYRDMQMRRLTQLLIADASAFDGAVGISNR